MNKKLRFAVIGCGDIAHIRYLPFVSEVENCVLVSVCDVDEKIAKETAHMFRAQNYFTDYIKILEDPRVDGVFITTDNKSHAEICINAMQAGKHVLVEKPMATSLSDANKLLQVARGIDTVFMPLPFDLYPAFVFAKGIINEGYIGNISFIDSSFFHCGPNHAKWFYTQKVGGGVLLDLGCYSLSLVTAFLGPVNNVFGDINTLIPERECRGSTIKVGVEDNVSILIQWPNGIQGTIKASWCAPFPKDEFLFQTTIYGTDGIIFLGYPPNPIVIYSKNKIVPESECINFLGLSKCYVPKIATQHDHLDILNYFVNCIRNRKSPVKYGPSGEHQRHVVEIMERVYQSSKSGKSQKVISSF